MRFNNSRATLFLATCLIGLILVCLADGVVTPVWVDAAAERAKDRCFR
jgi:hypothetical protein